MKGSVKKLMKLIALASSAIIGVSAIISQGVAINSSHDINNDGVINNKDIIMLKNAINNNNLNSAYDCNGDGVVDGKDIDTLADAVVDGIPVEKYSEARLYSLMPEKGSLMQSFVIRTKTGKLIVIDGGIDGDGFEKAAYMPHALRAIAGVGQNDYVEVDMWILSHAHKDHFNELRKTLEECTEDENFVIKNFCFDFPEFDTEEYPFSNADTPYLEKLRSALNKYAEKRGVPVSKGSTYYDDLNGALVNADRIKEGGCNIEIDGVRLEFLQTWSRSDGTNINDNSLIFRAWIEGQSVLFLQDTAVNGGKRFVDKYGEKVQSDIVQMAHHGQGGVSKEAYDAIGAKVRIWPTPIWVWNDTKTFAIGSTRQWVHGGVDFTTSDKYDIVTSLYSTYPTDAERSTVTGWKRVIDAMSIPLPYAEVENAPIYRYPTDGGTTGNSPIEEYRSENPVNYVGTFTNFDSASSLSTSSDSYVFGGKITGDLYLSQEATGNNPTSAASASLVSGKGYKGSNALEIKATNNSNQGLYVFATDANKNVTEYPDTSYLRMWVDFTDMDFRKATVGLVTKNGDLYSVGEKNGAFTPFYYLPENSTQWQTLQFGNDGCFGQQEKPEVKNFKGWLAFPTKDFMWWGGSAGGAKGDAFDSYAISGFYMFWCYAQNENHVGKPFYLDEIQLVGDYKLFDSNVSEVSPSSKYESENPVNYVGTFTNFDSASSLSTSSDSYVFGGKITGDLYLSQEATGNNPTSAASASLVSGKGYKGSNALEIKATNNSNQGLYVFATDANKNVTEYPDTSYLRMWVDFTDMDFRKATVGLVTKNGDLYSVGEKNGAFTPFYYLPENSTQWQTLQFGNDGCFGQQEKPEVKNFKGWLAFPTKDFMWWGGSAGGAKGDAFDSYAISGFYMFWCYAQNENHVGKPFYLDEIQLVSNYKSFETNKNG